MAGLDDLDVNTPIGADDPGSSGGGLGVDNQLRSIKAKTKEFAAPEHHYTGEHKFVAVATGELPAGVHGQFVVVKDDGVVYELKGYQRDDSTIIGILISGGESPVTNSLFSLASADPHGQEIGDAIMFTTGGALPSGVTANTIYYIIADGFTSTHLKVSETPAGAALSLSGTQSGPHYSYNAAWVKLTYNLEAGAAATALYNHRLATPIDHPNGSVGAIAIANDAVTQPKIAGGNIVKKHLHAASADPLGSISKLVEGGASDADALHYHPQYAITTSGGGGAIGYAGGNVTAWDGIISGSHPTYAKETEIFFYYPGGKTEIIARCEFIKGDTGNIGTFLRLKIGTDYSEALWVNEASPPTAVFHSAGDGVSVASLTANTWCSVEIECTSDASFESASVRNLSLTLI